MHVRNNVITEEVTKIDTVELVTSLHMNGLCNLILHTATNGVSETFQVMLFLDVESRQ